MVKKKDTNAKRPKKENREKKEKVEKKEKKISDKDSKDEIDDIFAAAKQKKSPSGGSEEKKKVSVPRPEDDSFSDIRGTKRKKRPLTEDGLPIYTAKEMGMGKGGDTEQCPFDCDCCF